MACRFYCLGHFFPPEGNDFPDAFLDSDFIVQRLSSELPTSVTVESLPVRLMMTRHGPLLRFPNHGLSLCRHIRRPRTAFLAFAQESELTCKRRIDRFQLVVAAFLIGVVLQLQVHPCQGKQRLRI